MRTTIMALMLTTILSLCAVSVAAELAKEETSSEKCYYTTTIQTLPMGKGREQINYESFGIRVNDTGKGLFHNASEHILGTMHVFNGIIDDSGFIVVTLHNGNQVFIMYKGSGKIGKPTIVKGTLTYIGGTGKAGGIQGTGEFTRYSLQPPAKGKRTSLSVSKVRWKIVEPKK